MRADKLVNEAIAWAAKQKDCHNAEQIATAYVIAHVGDRIADALERLCKATENMHS